MNWSFYSNPFIYDSSIMEASINKQEIYRYRIFKKRKEKVLCSAIHHTNCSNCTMSYKMEFKVQHTYCSFKAATMNKSRSQEFEKSIFTISMINFWNSEFCSLRDVMF